MTDGAVDNSYRAWNTHFTGDAAPTKELWSHRDDVTYMDRGGDFSVGRDQVVVSWDAQAAMKLGACRAGEHADHVGR